MILVGDQSVLLDGVTADVVICDPPYSPRVHSELVTNTTRYDGRSVAGVGPGLHYSAWTDDHVSDFVHSWSGRCRGWMVALTDSELCPVWRDAYRSAGRYSFAPVPCVMRGMSVRLAGDGPSSWTVYAMVARPKNREFVTWGTLPGAYVGERSTEAGNGRGKPDWLMRALVRDYSKLGDMVCDPFAGWGATLAAALGLGRRAMGAEIDPDVAAEGNRRINRGQQTDLFADHVSELQAGGE